MKRMIFGVLALMATSLLLTGCSDLTDDPIPSDLTITLLAIPGVTAPAIGATPVSGVNSAQYTGTISWSPVVSGTFASGTAYAATITLTPKSGYTLTGVAANSFTVDGATSVTHSAGSAVVSAVFPSTYSLGLTMVSVPAGSFQRDSTFTNISTVSAFKMSAHEITRAQFQEIIGADPSNTSYSSGTSDPVQPSWYQTLAFCNKLSIAEGLTPVYAVAGVDFAALSFAQIPTSANTAWNDATATWTNNGYRLPTEMEWMWAAMGAPADGQGSGTNTTGYAKAFAGSNGSNAIGDYAVFGYNEESETGRTTTERSNPVGSKTSGANELGLYDISGNVWEWCWDWYDTYSSGTLTDYRGATSGTSRVEHGGSWFHGAISCTVKSRNSFNPYGQNSVIGFRVVSL